MNMDHVPAFTLEPPKKAAEAKQVDTVRTPRFIDDVAAGRVELPTIPRVVHRLIAALRDDDVDIRTISEALSKDPVLTAKVLRVANSSFFGGQRSMASVEAAIGLIGIQSLNRLIVACGVSSTFDDTAGIDLKGFWRDALVAAVAATRLAPMLHADAEEAYVCGLLHATGHLILCRSYPEIANAMFSGFAVVRGAELCTIELEAFGIEHPTVGALWVESLGFPVSVSGAIGKMASPPTDAESSLDLTLRSARTLAAAVAQQEEVQVALQMLPTKAAAAICTPDGQANAAFAKLYAALQETEPSF